MKISLIKNKVKNNQYNLSSHAHNERQDEQITTTEIERTLLNGDIIEQYSDDPRGESCLVATKDLHVVCGLRNDRLLVVTVYKPQAPTWINWKTRAKELKSRA